MDEIAVSAQVRGYVDRVLRALNPDASIPQFEIDIVYTVHRSFATGVAAAHIGEFPARLSILLYTRTEPRGTRVLLGEFDHLLQKFTVARGTEEASGWLIAIVVARLGGEVETTVGVNR